MSSNPAYRVGLLVFLGLVIFVSGWFFLSHGLTGLSHYQISATFDDTKGLVEQTPVRLNGVTIGEVEKIELSRATESLNKPVVTLSIRKKYSNTIPTDSDIKISSGLLITNAQVEITPGDDPTYYQDDGHWDPAHVIEGGTLLASVSPEADKAVKEVTSLLVEMKPRIQGAMMSFEEILKRSNLAMANVQATTESVRGIVADPQIRRTLHTALNDMEAVSSELRRTANVVGTEMRGIVKRNSRRIDDLAGLTVETLQNIGDTVDAARSAITLISQQVSDPRLQQSLVETLELSRATVARLNQIASDIHSLTGDPTVQGDIKTTLANVKETTEQVKPVLEKVNTILGAIKPGGGPRLGIGSPSASIDFLGRGRSPGFRSDVNARIQFGQRNAFNLGLYDFAESYKLNAQAESSLSRFSSLRYGIYAGKLGVGFDWQPASRSRLSLDLWNPNNIQLDGKALIGITKDFSAIVGVDSIFNRPTPTLGVRFRP